jgi:anion-transporting  ArsA/GET3 family ATPase
VRGYPAGVGEFDGVRLHIVTGKGGTGKTTVAAAIALALAAGGGRVLLIEVEGRQGIAQLFDAPPLPYDERKVAVAPGGGDVYGLAVDVEQAFIEYLEMFYNLGRAGKALKRLGAVDFATTIAPGIRDVLLTGKVREAVGRREGTGLRYDAVVLDAPPTGRIVRFLNVTTEVAGLARVGPIHKQAEGVNALLRSSRTAVHVVTLLEEMPVQETIDAVKELRGIRVPIGAIIVNATRQSLLAPEELQRAAGGDVDLADIEQGLKSAGLEPSRALLTGLAQEVVEHAQRVELEGEEREAIAKLKRPTYELPLLPEAVDLGGLYWLAELLAEQGLS